MCARPRPRPRRATAKGGAIPAFTHLTVRCGGVAMGCAECLRRTKITIAATTTHAIQEQRSPHRLPWHLGNKQNKTNQTSWCAKWEHTGGKERTWVKQARIHRSRFLCKDSWPHSASDPGGTPCPPLVPKSQPTSQHHFFLSSALPDFGWRVPALNHRTSGIPLSPCVTWPGPLPSRSQ